jgi:N-acetylated-alpha-linked acidic dipeptidase
MILSAFIFLNTVLLRVKHVIATESLKIDLSALQDAIHSLQNASFYLDVEKAEAEFELRRFIKRWIKRRHSSLFKRIAKKIIRKLRGLFGGEKHEGLSLHTEEDHTVSPIPLDARVGRRTTIKPRIGRYPGWLEEQEQEGAYGLAMEAGAEVHLLLGVDSGHSALPRKFPLGKFKSLVRRVRAANRKLTAFERGFISKEGIKEREWYRHLGVAPGRWLGEHFSTILPLPLDAAD